jgi:hypothetical protein
LQKNRKFYACSIACNGVMITTSRNANVKKKRLIFQYVAITQNVTDEQPNALLSLIFNTKKTDPDLNNKDQSLSAIHVPSYITLIKFFACLPCLF